jgi:hypothetical protein
MKLSSIIDEFEALRLRELEVPATTTMPQQPGATTTVAPGQQIAQDPATQAKMMAQQALDRANKKKEIQDAIRQKQAELSDLQKQLAAIK